MKKPNTNPKEMESSEKRSLKFKKLSPKQKRLLEASALGVSGIAMGALAVSLMGFSNKAEDSSNISEPETVSEGEESAEVVIYPSAPFSEVVTSDMSFGEAFESARADVGAGGFFEWNGNTYNTYYKEEWDQLSDEAKTSFNESIDESRTVNEGEISDVDEVLRILNDLEQDESISIDEEDIVILDDEDVEKDVVVIEEEEDGMEEDDNTDEAESDIDDLDDDLSDFGL